jgi:hypothetical protein
VTVFALMKYIGGFKMVVDKYGNYVQKFIWQLCRWGRVDIGMTMRAFDFFYILGPARDWEILNCIKLTQHYKMY